MVICLQRRMRCSGMSFMHKHQTLKRAAKILERGLEARVRCCQDRRQEVWFCVRKKNHVCHIHSSSTIRGVFGEDKKNLWMAFVDLNKAFDRVPGEVMW